MLTKKGLSIAAMSVRLRDLDWKEMIPQTHCWVFFKAGIHSSWMCYLYWETGEVHFVRSSKGQKEKEKAMAKKELKHIKFLRDLGRLIEQADDMDMRTSVILRTLRGSIKHEKRFGQPVVLDSLSDFCTRVAEVMSGRPTVEQIQSIPTIEEEE